MRHSQIQKSKVRVTRSCDPVAQKTSNIFCKRHSVVRIENMSKSLLNVYHITKILNPL